MRFHLSHHLIAASLLLGTAAPALAQNSTPSTQATNTDTQPIPSVQHYWAQVEAKQSFLHLSEHGQMALLSILEAHHDVAVGQTHLAIPALTAASTHLLLASKADEHFIAAEEALHPAPQRPLSPHHVPQQGRTDWIPVSGDIIASTTLAPEQKNRVALADAQLKSGKSQQAAQTLGELRQQIDYIITLAPLSHTQQAVNRALTFAKANNSQGVQAALNDAVDSFVFVSENVITAATATNAHQH